MTTMEQDAVQMRRLLKVEPMAGLVTMQFLKNLMDLNPSLRPPMERQGLDELELWETLWTSVYAAPFDAMTTADVPQSGPTPPQAEAGEVDGIEHSEAAFESSGGSAIGEALLWTLESCFRDDFTPEARAAWETLYRFVNQMGQGPDESECGNELPPISQPPRKGNVLEMASTEAIV